MDKWLDTSLCIFLFPGVQHIYKRCQCWPARHHAGSDVRPISIEKSSVAPLPPLIQPWEELDKVFMSPLRAWIGRNIVEGEHKVVWTDITVNLHGCRRAFQNGSYRITNNVPNGLNGNLSLILSHRSQEITLWEEVMRQIATLKVQTQVMKYIHHDVKRRIDFWRRRFLQVVEQRRLQVITAHMTSAIVSYISSTIDFHTVFVC